MPPIRPQGVGWDLMEDLEDERQMATTTSILPAYEEIFARFFSLANPWAEVKAEEVHSFVQLWALAHTIAFDTANMTAGGTMEKNVLWRRAARHIRQAQILEGGPAQRVQKVQQTAINVLALCCFDAQWKQDRILDTPAVPICTDFPAALVSKDAFFRDKHVPGHIDFPDTTYQIDEDKAIIREHITDIVATFPDTAVLIEFGVDSAAKTALFLDQAVKQNKVCYYVVVDRSIKAIKDHLRLLRNVARPNVALRGWRGEFADAWPFFDKVPGKRVFLSLGSTLLDGPKPEMRTQPLERFLRDDDILYMSHDATDICDATKIKVAYSQPHFLNLVGGGLLSLRGYDNTAWQLEHELHRRGPLTCHNYTIHHRTGPRKTYDLFESVKFSPQYAQQLCQLRPFSITRIYERPKFGMHLYTVKPVSYLTFIAQAAAIRNPIILDHDMLDFKTFDMKFRRDPVAYFHKMLGATERTDLKTLLDSRKPASSVDWPHPVPAVDHNLSATERTFRMCPRVGNLSAYASAIVFGNLCGRQGLWPPEFRTYDQLMLLTEYVMPGMQPEGTSG